MNVIASSALIFDLVKLALFIAFACLAFSGYASYAKTPWLLAIATRRFLILSLITLLVIGIKVFEDVVDKESGPVDAALLLWVHETMPPQLVSFFGVITLGGAAKFLVPATFVVCACLFVTQHRREAALLAASMGSAWLLTYSIKALVARPRPELWNTTWYWGSSFPSGHTLSTAAFATALSLCAARVWPLSRYVSAPLAVVWIGLMGLSRLVLGVHWPSDVLAAICLGVFIPLAISLLVFKDDNHATHLTIDSRHQLGKLVD